MWYFRQDNFRIKEYLFFLIIINVCVRYDHPLVSKNLVHKRIFVDSIIIINIKVGMLNCSKQKLK